MLYADQILNKKTIDAKHREQIQIVKHDFLQHAMGKK